MDLHARRVGFGHLHRVGRLVAPDLEDADIGLRRFALEVVGLPEQIQPGLRLFEGLGVLLGLDLRDHLVFRHVELGAADGALGHLDLAVVPRARRRFFGLALTNLLFEIVELGAAIECVGDLCLAIEFDQEVAGMDGRSALHELRDHQRRRGRTGQPRRGDGRRLDRFNRSTESDRPDEIPLDDRICGLGAAAGQLRIPGGRPQRDRCDGSQHGNYDQSKSGARASSHRRFCLTPFVRWWHEWTHLSPAARTLGLSDGPSGHLVCL